MNDHVTVFPEYDAVDRIFAVVYLLIGYGFICLFAISFESWHISAFTLFYVLAVLSYIYGKGIRPSGESWFWLGVLLAIGIPFAFWTILEAVQFLVLMLAAAYWTLSVSGRLLEGKCTSRWVFFDCWNALMLIPFGNFSCQLRVLFGTKNNEEDKRKCYLGPVLLGIVLAVPVLMIILPLLSRADAGFAKLAEHALNYMQDHFRAILIRILFSLPVSFYLFGLMFGSISGRGADRLNAEGLEKSAGKVRRIPDVTMCTLMVVVCAVYAIFIGLQGNYLISAFFGNLPEEFTYAEYARQGFFELCRISGWNLVILGITGTFSRSSSREHKGLKVFTILLALLTLFLIGTAFSKLAMYISVYGLTVKRMISMTFLVWLAIVFGAVILRQKKEFQVVRICVMIGAVLFCVLCVFPIEHWIHGYNEWRNYAGI